MNQEQYLFLEVLICTVQQHTCKTNNDQGKKCLITQPSLINNKMYIPLTFLHIEENNLFADIINDVHLQISKPNCLILTEIFHILFCTIYL